MKHLRKFLFRWHWRIGLFAAFLILWIAITGLLLNHSRLFGLHHIDIDNSLILSAYNITPDTNEQSYSINLERFILDLHTGSFFRLSGKVLSDLVALAMIFLTLSGLYNIWTRKRRK